MAKPAARDFRIAVFKREINSIHLANFAYWHPIDGSDPSYASRAQYQRRRKRLDAIKRELLAMSYH
jgi:hypothetical protein